ncbi:MAG: hypothetical protein VX644_10960, partial [Planctomycetota bacterium]|nr:hypothetical protein [Planctomycetota bacterium]
SFRELWELYRRGHGSAFQELSGEKSRCRWIIQYIATGYRKRAGTQPARAFFFQARFRFPVAM